MGCAHEPCVLVVDDDEEIREGLAYMLRLEGYQVQTAAGGNEALSLLETMRPNLLLLDLMMPGVNGWDVVERLRAKPGAQVPICVVPAIASKAPDGTAALAKPIDMDELLRVVADHCGRPPH